MNVSILTVYAILSFPFFCSLAYVVTDICKVKKQDKNQYTKNMRVQLVVFVLFSIFLMYWSPLCLQTDDIASVEFLLLYFVGSIFLYAIHEVVFKEKFDDDNCESDWIILIGVLLAIPYCFWFLLFAVIVSEILYF